MIIPCAAAATYCYSSSSSYHYCCTSTTAQSALVCTPHHYSRAQQTTIPTCPCQLLSRRLHQPLVTRVDSNNLGCTAVTTRLVISLGHTTTNVTSCYVTSLPIGHLHQLPLLPVHLRKRPTGPLPCSTSRSMHPLALASQLLRSPIGRRHQLYHHFFHHHHYRRPKLRGYLRTRSLRFHRQPHPHHISAHLSHS